MSTPFNLEAVLRAFFRQFSAGNNQRCNDEAKRTTELLRQLDSGNVAKMERLIDEAMQRLNKPR